MTGRRLVVDIGGTNTRFGVSSASGNLSNVKIYPTAERLSFSDVLEDYLTELGAGPPASWCTGAHIAAAGVIDNGNVILTNAAWQISVAEVSRCLGSLPVRFVNDLEAVALLLPHLGPDDIVPIGPLSKPELVGNRVAVNIGTGFGAATAVRIGGDTWSVVASEAGHASMDLTYATADLSWCETIEDAISGPGIARLYASIAKLTTSTARPSSTDRTRYTDALFAHIKDDPAAEATMRLLTGAIGRTVGNLVLATTAWEGAFLCGSVARAWLASADTSLFRANFERKGTMSARMTRVPTYLMKPEEPALLGLTYGTLIKG